MDARFPLVVLLFLPLVASAQLHPLSDFQLTRISRNLITAPSFVYAGAQQYSGNQRDRWLEVEVEFTALPEVTDDLTLNYLILINRTLLSGEVTHTNIVAGRGNRSVMYVSPSVLARVTGSRTMAANLVQNICVQILQNGSVKSQLTLVRAEPEWYDKLPRVPGLVLNKSQTPFAPLYWDRYAQIKTSP